MIVGLAGRLLRPRDVRTATAVMRPHIPPGSRVGVEGAMRALAPLATLLGLGLFVRLRALARGRAGVVRRLRRRVELGFKVSDTGRQKADRLSLRQDQGVLGSLVQAQQIRWQSHPQVDSRPESAVKQPSLACLRPRRLSNYVKRMVVPPAPSPFTI